MLNYKNNPIFSKEPYYDKESNVCVLLSEKAIFSPLGRIDRRAFVLLILIDILIVNCKNKLHIFHNQAE